MAAVGTSSRSTEDLSLAAMMVALGGTVSEVDASRGRGEVTVDVRRISATKIRELCEVLTEQMLELPDQPTFEQLEQVVGNTFLSRLFEQRDTLRTRILNQKRLR
jgi:hypothetical protein